MSAALSRSTATTALTASLSLSTAPRRIVSTYNTQRDGDKKGERKTRRRIRERVTGKGNEEGSERGGEGEM